MDNKLSELKALALIWSRSEVARMPVEEFADVTGTPLEDVRVMFGAANALDDLIDHNEELLKDFEAAEARVKELEEQRAEDAIYAEGSIGRIEVLEHFLAKAEAELARRDAASGEPVGYLRMTDDDCEFNGHNEFSGGGRGVPVYTAQPQALQNFRDAMQGIGHIRRTLEETFGGLHGTHVEPDVLAECKEVCDAIYAAYRRTAPPPAALPPEMPALGNNDALHDYTTGWNDCIDASKSLGCQPQKVVELESSDADWMLSPNDYRNMVVNALDAAGIPWKEAE